MQGPFEARPIDRQDLIEGLGKGLRVIEAFDDDHPRLTPSGTAASTGLTRSAARRFLLSLVHFGYADTDGKHFWLTPKVLRLGQSYLDAARLPRLVQPFIQRAAAETDETVNFAVLDGHEIVYLARSNAPRFVSIGYQVGVRVPAHVVTPGTVIASTWGEEQLADWLAAHDFSAFTAHTVTDPARFRDGVRAARALDYWIAEQQLDLGLAGIAVAVKDRKGACVGTVGMTISLQARTREEMVDRFLPPLRDAARALRAVL